MSFCVWLGPDADPGKLGGKARSLLRLRAAGLRVPDAVVVTSDLFAWMRADGPALPPPPAAPAAWAGPATLAAIARASEALDGRPWPEGLPGTLATMLRALAREPSARFAVRSSASIEDDARALAAGLFLSRLDLPAGAVPDALRAVFLSALAPGVLAYLARRGLGADTLGVAVLIHPFVTGDAAGTAAIDPTDPTDTSSSAPAIEAHSGDAGAARAGLVGALTRLAALHGPVEVEWVANGSEVTFLQLRPYQRPRAARAIGGLHPGGAWRWDAAHNPLPLSPAQAGLVALVDGSCQTGFRQRVAGGYLFCRADDATAGTQEGTPRCSATDALRALRSVADPRLAQPAPTLEAALATFTAIYQPLFGVVQPAARAARAALSAFLRRHAIDAAPQLAALLTAIPSAAEERRRRARAFIDACDATARATARDAYLEAFGDESSDWDVAVPTWREAPEALERRLLGARRDGRPATESGTFRAAASTIREALPPAARDDWEIHLAAARAGAAAGEDDDALYARVAAHVRHALLREGARLVERGVLERPAEIFWLALEVVRDDARGVVELSRAEAVRHLAAAAAAHAEARANPPPLAIADAARAETAGLIRGRSGAGGTCIGRVRIGVDTDRAADIASTEVLVARTILPTELPLVAAAALVIETGGPLDHVAAQARERGIPAVVGAVGACDRLRDGDRVLVDGEAGLVVKLGADD